MTEVEISAKEACQNYAFGYALACFMTSTAMAAVVIHGTSYSSTVLILFIAVSVLGAVSFVSAYTVPIRFYELLEQEEVSE